MNPLICSICGQPIPEDPMGWTEGHNAAPVNNGRCCALCNWQTVIPARLARIFTINKDKQKGSDDD